MNELPKDNGPRTKSFALRRVLQAMAIVLAKMHNKEAGDFDRNPLWASAFLSQYGVAARLYSGAILPLAAPGLETKMLSAQPLMIKSEVREPLIKS